MDCLFCKIISGEIPCKKAYEDDKILAFHDISPLAPVHVLIIPKEHYESLADINEQNCGIVGEISAVASKLSRELGLENGFRLVTNVGVDGAQSVSHLHFHLLGGKKLSERIC